jgi:hypothetical protein
VTDLTTASVLAKTALGQAAIKLHDRSLPQQARALLILADGVKSVEAIARFTPNPSEALQMAQILMDSGLASLVGQASAPKTPSVAPQAAQAPKSAVPAGSAPASAVFDIKQSIRTATRALNDLLGPHADPFSAKLEKCKTRDELIAKIYEIKPVVVSMRSAQKADDFLAIALPK